MKDVVLPLEWFSKNENHPTQIQNNTIDLDYIQQYLGSLVRISFYEQRWRSPLLIIERSHRSHIASTSSIKTEPLRKDQELKLKVVKIESQVSTPCYSVNSRLFEEEVEGQNSPTKTKNFNST